MIEKLSKRLAIPRKASLGVGLLESELRSSDSSRSRLSSDRLVIPREASAGVGPLKSEAISSESMLLVVVFWFVLGSVRVRKPSALLKAGLKSILLIWFERQKFLSRREYVDASRLKVLLGAQCGDSHLRGVVGI